mmetsp:Transcript_3969/g.8639  ORF Transcript_3969/g.8639 Transcript_3969/m.8639 type:complete len:82 (-) Transcript_3969:168-413(-)
MNQTTRSTRPPPFHIMLSCKEIRDPQNLGKSIHLAGIEVRSQSQAIDESQCECSVLLTVTHTVASAEADGRRAARRGKDLR